MTALQPALAVRRGFAAQRLALLCTRGLLPTDALGTITLETDRKIVWLVKVER